MKQPTLYICCQLFYPELISTGQTLTELCESLSDKGANIHILCAQPTLQQREYVPKFIDYKGIKIERIWSTRFPKLSFIGKCINHISFTCSMLIRLIRLPQNAQILFLTNPPILPLLMLCLYRLKKFKFSLLVFDVYPETLISAGLISQDNVMVRLYKYFNRIIYERATHVFVIGRCMKQIIDAYQNKKRISTHYIPIWSDDQRIQQTNHPSHFRELWGLETAFIVGYSGNLASFHPIETFLETAKRCKGRGIHFVFVGDGAKMQLAKNFSRDNQLTHCHFFNYVPREQLGDLLASFDCGLVGLNSENTGLSVPSKTLGLLSAGVPVVASCDKHSELSLILKDYNCGFVCDDFNPETLKSHILTYKNNSSLLLKHKKNALRAIQDAYNLEHISKQYFQLLFES